MRMDYERLDIFTESLEEIMPEVLREIEREAYADDVPIIRRGTRSFLRVLLAAKKPETVLEVGTAVGFSSVFMMTYSDARVTTIENYPKRIPVAAANFKRAGLEDRVEFLTGDALAILPELKGSYDLIFLDAAKGQYIVMLPDLLRLLAPGGILVADNILQEGETLDSRFAVERRNRTIHRRVREYLEAVYTNPELETTILPVGDGLAMSVKSGTT